MARRLLVLPLLAAFAALPLLASSPAPARADHSWGSYHWARTSNPFTLKVGDNVSSKWDDYLNTAVTDWSKSTVLDLQSVTGGTRPKTCKAASGRIEACSERYGFNGWLGIAQIWVSGSHITQATTKVNDSYFNTSTYNTPAWKRLVMCQEIAHDFGLDHQDENFNNANLGSCMDYTSDPDGPPSNEHPNAHDFEQLGTIYSHLDSTTTIGLSVETGRGRSETAADEGPNNPADFGRPVGPKDGLGRQILFVKDLGNNQRLFTHVFWTLERHPNQR